jgi:hypothetical protein
MSASVPSRAPFPEVCALNVEHLDSSTQPETIAHIPGDPTVSLRSHDVSAYLLAELATPLLDEIYDKLWLVARKVGSSIDALHVQIIRGRAIVPSEDPGLHLVWMRDKIYIKPLPICLLNYAFWIMHLQLTESKEIDSNGALASESTTTCFDRTIALGFLRSYAFLIRHQLDFILAKESHLIPDDVDWVKWSRFINNFRTVEDRHVAKRYHYGQLRISRLNWVVRLYRPQNANTWWFYEIPHWSVQDYVAQAIVPLLFLFASTSLVLSSMQVVLSVPVDDLWFQDSDGFGLRYISRAFWTFSIGILLLSGVVWALLFAIPFLALSWQLSWGFQKQRERAKGSPNV